MKMHNEVAEQIISLSPAYNEKLMCLNEGIKLDAPQKEFMDRFERMYEFARPKLARKEVVGEGGGPVAHSVKISFE